MATNKSVFLIGPGYIGSEILFHLVAEGYPSITVLVRSPSSANALTDRFGDKIQIVHGTLADSEIITRHASQSDIVIHCATSDDPPSVKAVLTGIKKRVSMLRDATISGASVAGAAAGPTTPPIYIHTSGTSLITDGSKGNPPAADYTIFDDAAGPEQIDALPDSAPHRNVDLLIVRARAELGSDYWGRNLVIVIPPMIEGAGEPGVGSGRLSIQVPTLVRFALKKGYAGYVGKGLAVSPWVHVKDLARSYMTLLHRLESDDDDDDDDDDCNDDDLARNPYFFVECGEEVTWRDVAVVIGRELHRHGKIDSPEPRTIPEGDYGELFGPSTVAVIGANARARASRFRKLGWSVREKRPLEAVIAEDVIPLVLTE